MVVSRPNVLMLPVRALVGLVGVAVLVEEGDRVAGLLFGGLVTLVFALGALGLATTRVVVEGAVLRRRRFGRWSEPVRLDRLVSAELTPWIWWRPSGVLLRLADAA